MKRLLLTCVVVFSLAAGSASALTVCHDFTWFRVSGADGDNLGKEAMKTQLRSRQYRPIFTFNSGDAAALAKGQRYLRTGDVVIIGAGNGHSGFMAANGIEHFIQVPGEVGMKRNPMSLPRGPIRSPKAASEAFGGHFIGDSLVQMLGRLSDRRPQPVEIWSKTNDLKVTINWNTRTDVDLWVEEPGNVKCWYQNRQTTNGGHLLEDITSGFGPEHYALARSAPGNYVIKVNYYSGPRNAKVEPTNVTIVVTQFENTPNARTQTFTTTLNNRGEAKVVHTVRFE